MSLISRLFPARPDDRAMLRPLWHRVVAIAREPQWYSQGGIADTLPGRFDAIALVLALVLLRMERSPALATLSAKLTELFVEDMDGQLRQSGVGDLVVGKQMGKLMGVLGGRIGALREALEQDDTALAVVIARNVTLVEGSDPMIVARAARVLAGQFAALPDDAVLAAEIAR